MSEQNDISKQHQGSKFHSQWLKIKDSYNKGGEKFGGAEAAIKNFEKNMKGKETLTEKITKSDITEWKEQKYHKLAFFQNISKTIKTSDGPKIFHNKLEEATKEFKKHELELTEDSLEYKELEDDRKNRIKELGDQLLEHYLKNGLTNNEANKKLEIEGPNMLPQPEKTSLILKFFHELSSPFAIMMIIGGILAIIAFVLASEDTQNLWLAIVLWVVVLITAIFSLYQNEKADSIMESLMSYADAKASVTRDGQIKQVSTIDLVVGDVVSINTGDKIPADLRIFEASNFTVDNSGLTGESEPFKINGICGESGYDRPTDARNIVFLSTNCFSGTGKGVVIRTGKDSYMGQIAELTFSSKQEEIQLLLEIDRFIFIIAIFAIALGIGFFFGSIGIGFPLISSFTFAIGIIVACIPEGLLSCITVTLALTSFNLQKKNITAKNLRSFETLGSITCICSDKTGTLTQNKMKVVHLWYDCEIKNVDKNQEAIEVDETYMGNNLYSINDSTFKYLEFTGVCGSFANFVKDTPDEYYPLKNERNKWIKENPHANKEEISVKISQLKAKFKSEYEKVYKLNISERITEGGNASESGIIKFFEENRLIDSVREQYPQTKVNGIDIKVPFDSKIKCTASLRTVTDSNDRNESYFWLAVKGAPDYLIKRCSKYLMNGKEYQINDFFKNKFKDANSAFALKGERVLGFALAKLDKNSYPENYQFKNANSETGESQNFDFENLTFVGLIGMEDPPRPGVKEAITICKKAGIKVIMVTGDQTLTAASIAYQIGIIESLDDSPEVIMEKENLKTIEDAEKKSNSIIIDGTRLAKMIKTNDHLSDDNPEKGAFLRDWIMKRDVVFARTTPDQKLMIVEACQKLSHIVAVTGDGVNDSPAIKRSNIGIAMGIVGTDVAKDAADLILMDDNFASIVEGIKQGRIVFDTLKKIIAYNMCSNVPEFLPVVGFFIFGFPIPLTTFSILIIDVCADIYPNVAMAYEGAESNTMNEKPRNIKIDRLCSYKLLGWSFGFLGILHTSGGMLSYFVVMNDYGFKPEGTLKLTYQKFTIPGLRDIFNPDDIYRGNSNAFLLDNADKLGIEGDN